MAKRGTRKLIRVALHGLLAAWMTVVAVAPLWHSGHSTRPVSEKAPGHQHAGGAWMCNAAPKTVDPAVDCVLCKAQRQLSQYWARTPGVSATIQSTPTQAPPSLFVPRAGEHVPVAARAPPLC